MAPTTPGAGVSVPAALVDAANGGAWLASGWTAAAAVAVCLALTAALSLWWRRRRRAGRRTARSRVVALATATCLAWALGVAVVANSVLGLVPDGTGLVRLVQGWTGSPVSYATAGGGRVETVQVPGSPALAVPRSTAWVYAPPGFDPAATTRYPVAYLVHGFPGRSPDWFTLGRVDRVMDQMIAAGLVPPMLVVAPDMNGGPVRDGECLDAAGGPQVESWTYQVLVPFVDATYPTLARREGRVLGGMSSGGYCALDQGLRHQDTWGAVLGFEPYGSPGPAGGAFGDAAAVASRSPSVYLPTVTFSAPLPMYLDVGSDGGVSQVRALAQQVADRGQPVLFRVNAGQGHTWGEVRAGVPFAMAFAARYVSPPA